MNEQNSTSEDTRPQDVAPGVQVCEVVEARTPESVAEFLANATASQSSVIPFGGRHSLATGHPIGPAQYGLDLTGLRGVIAYEPADLTMSVWAGTTMAEIQAELGANGQELPIDVPRPGSTTIGGLVATGFAGPRRLRSGSLRDLLIGCAFVRGDGLAAKAGGMVVKNVSGFEIPRFLHGSWGALAVLTSVNLKVTPRSRADGTVVAIFPDLSGAIEGCHTLIASEPSIESCVVVKRGQEIVVAARSVGRAAAVRETLASFAKALGDVQEILDGDASIDFWQQLVDHFSEAPQTLAMAMSSRPRDVASLAAAVDVIVSNLSGPELLASPGLGTIRVAIPVVDLDAGNLIRELASIAIEHRASYVLESAPPALRSIVPAWGSSPDGLELMRSVKREFDPAGILNPSRLFV